MGGSHRSGGAGPQPVAVAARILDARSEAARAKAIPTAVEALRAGALVGMPTETVYGLAADARNEDAIARIFRAKGRPAEDPLILHVADLSGLSSIVPDVAITPMVRRLAERFWPGPLTLVLPRRPEVSSRLTGGLDTVAVRVPAHPVARALLEAFGGPLAAPSANPFAYVSPTCAAHVAQHFGDEVALVLDGGPARVGVESTIVMLLPGEEPLLLREGGLERELLQSVMGPLRVGRRVLERPLAPGQYARHYAPRIPLRLLESGVLAPPAERRERLLLVLSGAAPAGSEGYAACWELSASGDLSGAAQSLFSTLRRLDGDLPAEVRAVDVLPCPEEGLGRAIMDRLRRAATPVSGGDSLPDSNPLPPHEDAT